MCCLFQIINRKNSRELFIYYVRLSCSVSVQVANKLRFISDKFDSEGGTKHVMGKTNLLQRVDLLHPKRLPPVF